MTEEEQLDALTAQAAQARAVGGMVLLTPNETDALVAEVRRLRALVPPEGATVLVPRDPTECYECGVLVGPDEGEKHGRSGWVHFSCLEAASP